MERRPFQVQLKCGLTLIITAENHAVAELDARYGWSFPLFKSGELRDRGEVAICMGIDEIGDEL